jgi:uncharacterized protein
MKKALIVQGGWDGHEPLLVSERFRKLLEQEGFEVEVSDSLDAFLDVEKLKALDLIVPVWTMGVISNEQVGPVLEAVASGVGIAGCHGGMCDSFRDNVNWQFMTGGQWVSHPGNDGTEYTVNIKKGSSPIVDGIEDFVVSSEQYYLHVDPAIEILATTDFPVAKGFHTPNGKVSIPVTWTKRWGHGRVFYTSLGHHNDVFDNPPALEMMKRGLLWASESKELAVANDLNIDIFK